MGASGVKFRERNIIPLNMEYMEYIDFAIRRIAFYISKNRTDLRPITLES